MPLHLVDASPYIFRAFHTLPDSIRDPEGRPTNAVHGFVDFLLRLVREEEVTHIAVCFDFDLVSSFRTAIYPAYKANRPAPPPPLLSQLGPCREAADALGMRTFIAEGYEADDLIATLVRPPAVIVSGDKDLAQLVTDEVALYDLARDERYGPGDVLAKFGVRPDQIADLLALAGDATDNIPGVAGIGKKTAAKLLQRFGHVESIDWGGLRGPMAMGRESALLSKRLAVAARDAPVSATLDELRYLGADPAAADAFCARLGSGRLRARIPLRP